MKTWHLAILAIGFLCGVVSGQEFRVEVIQPNAAQTELRPVYWVMFSGTYCGPCQRWKSSELPKLHEAKIDVTVINVDEDDRWNAKYGVTTVPRFFLLDRATRKTVKGPFVGFQSAMKMISITTDRNFMAPPKRDRVARRLSCDEIRSRVRARYHSQTALMSDVVPQSMVWMHLTDGSVGTHNYTRNQVSCLALWEALALHDDAHNVNPAIRPEY